MMIRLSIPSIILDVLNSDMTEIMAGSTQFLLGCDTKKLFYSLNYPPVTMLQVEVQLLSYGQVREFCEFVSLYIASHNEAHLP